MPCDPGAFIQSWRAAVESEDMPDVFAHLADTMTFHSPAVFKPATERPYINKLLTFVGESIEDFAYAETYTQPGGAAMVFRGKIGGLVIEGIDLFKLDNDNKVTELKVMLRPLNAAVMLAQSMRSKFEAAEGNRA